MVTDGGRNPSTETVTPLPDASVQQTSSGFKSSARDVKAKTPLRESIEMVAVQLLNKPNSTEIETPIVTDTRIPPKLKTQIKHKIKTRTDEGDQLEYAHPGEAVPVTIEELNPENKVNEAVKEFSTSSAGISTWSSLNTISKENASTEPSRAEVQEKKNKPAKSKPKRPQTNKISKRPIIGSTNKADLVAGGSAISENVYNKLKNTVLANVEKNKNIRTSTTSTTTTETPTTKKDLRTTVIPSVTISTRPKKKSKNKPKTTTTTTLAPSVIEESALLPTEAKEQEIELEVSTPAMTTKKPKRSSNKKKNKTKRRKTSTPKPVTDVAISDVKISNKTKLNKNNKKPTSETSPITTQIYNYLSREVMPSVGVGMLGLASLVGIAGYFLYPFATPVRRTFEVDKSDDLYRNNAEEYASDGNGQAEEEMLGTVLAGMPAHAKQKLNPYAAQTPHMSRYPTKKEQDIRYRHVTPAYNPNYKVHYAQQKTGIAHGAVYPKPAYGQYETRHAYATESKQTIDKPKQPNYTPYSAAAVEPIYAAPQTGPSGISSYGSDSSNSVVYGVKPSPESDFKPVYPFEGQHFSETTSSPVTYSPTSMYLGSNNNADNQEDVTKYDEFTSLTAEGSENQFVVGNVPKEFSDSATPAVVPEHGPRNLRKKRSISDSLEELVNDDPDKDVFISNEIDDFYSSNPIRNFAPFALHDISFTPSNTMSDNLVSGPSTDIIAGTGSTTSTPALSTDIITKDSSNTTKLNVIRSIDSTSTNKSVTSNEVTTNVPVITSNNTKVPSTQEIIESISTSPISNTKDGSKTETELYDEPETTDPDLFNTEEDILSTTPNSRRINPVYTTTESTVKTTPSTTISNIKYDTRQPIETTTENIDLSTYPPQTGLYSWLQQLVVFKLRLGLGLIQSTVDVLNKLKVDTKSLLDNA